MPESERCVASHFQTTLRIYRLMPIEVAFARHLRQGRRNGFERFGARIRKATRRRTVGPPVSGEHTDV